MMNRILDYSGLVKALFLRWPNHPQNVNGKKDLGDIWILCGLEEQDGTGSWRKCNHDDHTMREQGSVHGNQLFLVNHFGKKGGRCFNTGNFVSKRTDSGWSALKIIHP